MDLILDAAFEEIQNRKQAFKKRINDQPVSQGKKKRNLIQQVLEYTFFTFPVQVELFK